jgi:HK97 family phage prohead protease
MYKCRAYPFDVKTIEKDGSFAGYLSVFGNVDSYKDVVNPGAFRDSLADWQGKGAMPPVLWQHKSDQPIGVFTSMVEDDKGLKTEGRLLVNDVPKAAEAHALLKHKAVRGLSIGYDAVDEQWDPKAKVNNLKKLTLWEGSIVTFPANPQTLVDEVKSMLEHGTLPTLRQFESLLRDAGYSRKVAAEIATGGYKSVYERELGAAADGADGKSMLDLVAKTIDSFDFKL